MYRKIQNISRAAVILVLVLANVGCDQISKHIVREEISPDQNFLYLNGHLMLTSVENKGAFLSLGHNITGPLHYLIFIALPAVFLIGLLIYLMIKQSLDVYIALAAAFLIGGGIGNVYDRAAHGSVTDFLYLQFGNLHTGIFNMADISVSIGAVLLLLYSFWSKKKEAVKY